MTFDIYPPTTQARLAS